MESSGARLTTPLIRFAADGMLGRLAKMLRLLGYDTAYSPEFTVRELRATASMQNRVVLTRGSLEKRFPGQERVFSVQSEYPTLQLREVVERFGLDTRAWLWTRCTRCNGTIQKLDKACVEGEVAPKVFQVYQNFYRCTACRQVYWRGSHVNRILDNLDRILGHPE